jgi:predicted nucleic-acid-binding protein
MPGLDTNVLVRWVVDDDPAQGAQSQALFDSVHREGGLLFVPATVVLELEWVLRSRYRMTKAVVLQVLNALLETRELEFQNEPAVERAVHAYASTAADFADCLHAGLCAAAHRAPLLTFDRLAARLPQVQLTAR